MKELIGIVNKPQFDTDVFKVGEAIRVVKKSARAYEAFNVKAIIKNNNPLYITVAYYSESECDMTDMNLSIDDVVHGNYTLDLLKEA